MMTRNFATLSGFHIFVKVILVHCGGRAGVVEPDDADLDFLDAAEERRPRLREEYAHDDRRQKCGNLIPWRNPSHHGASPLPKLYFPPKQAFLLGKV